MGPTAAFGPRRRSCRREETPDFRLRVTPDQDLSLVELRGRPVIVAFYPADWSPVCGDQMASTTMSCPNFKKHGAKVLGIRSMAPGVKGLRGAPKLHFPCSRFRTERRGRQELRRLPEYRRRRRACAVRDRQARSGSWSYLSPIAVNPGADGILDALEGLQRKEQVPAA